MIINSGEYIMYNIYIVDDESDLLLIIKKYLEKENYNVKTFSNGDKAMNAIGDDVHLWLLDIMLGTDINGYDIIKAIKNRHAVPVIFMSARDQQLDRIMGLELGSDDYITKPFSMREMVLRVNNVIKRVYGDVKNIVINHNDYIIDIKKRSILKDDINITLTSKEMDMVILLLNNHNISFEREELLLKVWGNDYYGSDRVVDDLIKRIRKKLPYFGIETI